MRIFVTGGTGTIGTPVVAELIEHGHSVLALARSAASADKLTAAGAEVLRGELSDLETLASGAGRCDGAVALAFTPNYSTEEGLAAAIVEETAAAKALADALAGSDRPLVITSGTPWMAGRPSTEADPLPSVGPVAGRARTVEALLSRGSAGPRVTAIRLPRTVHNEGMGGFAGLLTDHARRAGAVGYPGDGTQRWPAVHARDAASLFRLALESAPAGSSWHAVADEGDAVRDIAAVIGRRLGLEVRSVPEESFGPFGALFAMDQPASSQHTREALGWAPTHPSLLEDLELIEP